MRDTVTAATKARSEDPAGQRDNRENRHCDLAPRHRTHLTQLRRGPSRHTRAVGDRRRIHEVGDERREHEEHKADRQEPQHPAGPGHVNLRDRSRHLGGQEVGRLARDEHRARETRRRERDPEQVRANRARILRRRRAVQRRDVLDDGIDRAGAARGVRRHERRQHEIRQRDRVPEAERSRSKSGDERQCDPPAEPGHLISQRERGRGEHEPDDLVAESRERPADGFGRCRFDEAEPGRDADAQHADGRTRQRLSDEAGNHEDEQREIAPGAGLQARRHGQHQHQTAEARRHQPSLSRIG